MTRRLLSLLVAVAIGAAALVAVLVTPDDDAGHHLWPLGDSVTFGAAEFGDPVAGGYRAPLSELLDERGIAHTFVGTSTDNAPADDDPTSFRHDGHPGFTIDDLRRSLDGPTPLGDAGRWLTGTAARPPVTADIAIVQAGTNDVIEARGGVGPDGDPPPPLEPAERRRVVEQMAAEMQGLLDAIRTLDPGTSVILCTATPLLFDGPADPTIVEFNQALRAEVVPALQGAGLTIAVADVERAFLGAGRPIGELLAEGIHPSAAGYQVMADTIAPAVSGLVGTRPPRE